MRVKHNTFGMDGWITTAERRALGSGRRSRRDRSKRVFSNHRFTRCRDGVSRCLFDGERLIRACDFKVSFVRLKTSARGQRHRVERTDGMPPRRAMATRASRGNGGSNNALIDLTNRGGEASTNDGGALRGRTTRKRARREGDGVRETQTKKTKPTTRETTRGSKRDEKTTEREEELVCAENLTRGDGAYRSRGRIATVLDAF